MPPYNTKIKPIVSDTNVTSYSDPFTGESFILPTSAHNTQAKINYDKQKALRKRTQDLIALDPQTAESWLLNIGGAWEEGRLRDEFRDIRKTGVEAERKKAEKKAKDKASVEWTKRGIRMYPDKDKLAYMERNSPGIENVMKGCNGDISCFVNKMEPVEERFDRDVHLSLTDGLKVFTGLKLVREKLSQSEAALFALDDEIKGGGKLTPEQQKEYKLYSEEVASLRSFESRASKELLKGTKLDPNSSPVGNARFGSNLAKLNKKTETTDKKSGKKTSTLQWFKDKFDFFNNQSPIKKDVSVKPASPEKIQLTNEVTRLTKERDALKNAPKGKLTDEAFREAVEGSLEPKWEQERGQGYYPPDKQQPPINLEGTSDRGLPADWRTRQSTQSDIRGRGSLADQFAPSINLDGTSAQEVTTKPTDQVATTPIEPFTAKTDESMPMLSDSGGGEVFHQVVAEKETGMGFLDVVKSIKRIAVEESPRVAQEVLDGIKGFTNHVVKEVTSPESLLWLRPDEDTPDPNKGTPTPSGDGTGFVEGMNMMASSGYESVAPAVKEKFNWAKEKLKGLTGGFLDWQRRDPSSTGRPSGFSGSREEQFLTPNKKEFNPSVLAGDTLSGIEQAYKHGSKIEGMKPRYFPALKRTEGGTEHDSSARGDFALMPRYMTATPYFLNKYGKVKDLKAKGKYKKSMEKFSQELDNPAINARVAAEFTYINHKALKDNIVTGAWADMNSSTQARQDWEDLLSATHYLGQTDMEKILGELYDADPKKGRGVTMSTLMDYFKNSSEPLVNIAHSHVERFRGYRKEKRKRGR